MSNNDIYQLIMTFDFTICFLLPRGANAFIVDFMFVDFIVQALIINKPCRP